MINFMQIQVSLNGRERYLPQENLRCFPKMGMGWEIDVCHLIGKSLLNKTTLILNK